MKFFLLILALFFFRTPSFAQWKTYYPEGKAVKKNQKETSTTKNKQLFESHLFNALKSKSLEDNQQALRYFEKCIKLDKNIPLPFYEAAIINAANGDYVVALEQVKKAIKIEPRNRWYLLLYGNILFSNQEFLNAAAQYKKLIKIDPANEELYFKLSEIYIYANDLNKAIKVYNDLEKYKGIDKMISMQKHKLYRELNNIKGAINELNLILDVFPNDIEVMEILSELYLLNDQKEKAFEEFKKIAFIDPNNGRIHLTLADYYRENGENKKSYNELKLAFKSTELKIDTKVRILFSYYQLLAVNEEIRDQAYELAEILIKTHPEDLKARAVFADVLYFDNQYEEAKKQYLIILESDKSKNQLWSQVLFIQAEQNDFDGMLKISKEALEYFPSEPLFYYFNGASNKWLENYETAIISLETGVEFVVANKDLLVEFYLSLGDIYHTINQYELSDNYYEKGLELDSNNVIILNNYAYYLSLRGEKLSRAKEMSFRSNTLKPDNSTYQDTYAWVLYKLKEYRLAKEWLLKALLNGGDKSPVIIEHYGDVLYRLGEMKESLNQWKKARELGGSTPFLNQKIEEGILYE